MVSSFRFRDIVIRVFVMDEDGRTMNWGFQQVDMDNMHSLEALPIGTLSQLPRITTAFIFAVLLH